MPDPTDKPAGQAEPKNGNPSPCSPDGGKPDTNGNGKQPDPGTLSNSELIHKLKQGLDKTRLPADLRDEILADMPPLEERIQLFQELRKNGGLSSEEFLKSLELWGDPQP